jgi:hypothetical protein
MQACLPTDPSQAAGAGEVGDAATATTVVAAMTDATYCGSATVAGCRSPTTVAACCASAVTRSSSVVIAASRGSEASAAPREPSLAVAAALPAARDALDERRLVGTATSDLNTLAGARGAWWAPPWEREDKKVKLSLI